MEGFDSKSNLDHTHCFLTLTPTFCPPFLNLSPPTPVFLSGKIPWTKEPGGLQPTGGHKESDMTEHHSYQNTPSSWRLLT